MMKVFSRKVAAVVLAIVLSLAYVPATVAAPRDREDIGSKITRIIKKLQRLVGITTTEDAPVPPRP
ncbi:MAG TPA: hypothetical protein VHL59_13585 [Thermoanaerobaculia bacterium]|nr:hypothetical protein [Thermoanaerobaculia bacterium]